MKSSCRHPCCCGLLAARRFASERCPGFPSLVRPARCNGRVPDAIVKRNSFKGPGVHNVDARVARSFPIHESVSLQLWAEAFNALNHKNILGVNTNLYTYMFGPQFYFHHYSRFTPFVQDLFGVAHTNAFGATHNSFAMAVDSGLVAGRR